MMYFVHVQYSVCLDTCVLKCQIFGSTPCSVSQEHEHVLSFPIDGFFISRPHVADVLTVMVQRKYLISLAHGAKLIRHYPEPSVL